MVRLTPFQFLSALATFDLTTLLLLCCLVLLASLPGAAAGPSTRFIDDQAGDSVTGVVPFYQGQWALGSNCPSCVLKPNPAKTYMGTWHDATVQPGGFKNMIITFTGTAINIFGIIPRAMDSGTITNTNLTFTLDEKLSDVRYIQAGLDASSPEPFLYNQSVYSVMGLNNTEHTLRIEPQVGDNGSVFLFDYATYIFDDGEGSPENGTSTNVFQPMASQPVPSQLTQSNTNTTPVAAIVAGVVIGLLLFAVLVFLALWYHRRRRNGSVGHIEDRLDFSRKSPTVPVPITFHGRPSSPSPSSVFSIRALPKEPSLPQQPARSARSSLEIPTRSVTPSLSYAGSAPHQAPKASEREAELERQLAVARAALSDASSSGSLSRNLSTVTSFKRSSLTDADDAQLRTQVQHLQMEVDRLRASTREVEAPPAYV